MIKTKDNSTHYTWGECCESWVLKENQKFSVKQEKMPPNTSEKLHYHQIAEQLFYILSGEAVFYINNEKFSLKAGESISIIPLSKHYISNETLADLEFLVISQPSTDNDRIETQI